MATFTFLSKMLAPSTESTFSKMPQYDVLVRRVVTIVTSIFFRSTSQATVFIEEASVIPFSVRRSMVTPDVRGASFWSSNSFYSLFVGRANVSGGELVIVGFLRLFLTKSFQVSWGESHQK